MYKFNLANNLALGQGSLEFNLGVKGSDIPEDPQEVYGYNTSLNECRDRIDKIDGDNWKKVRWFINKYDFLVKDPIINRAFYKYWEVINEFDIFEGYSEDDIILHCAEAPGGFIQGTNIYLQVERQPMVSKGVKTNVDNDGFMTVQSKKKKSRKFKIYTISLNKDLPQYRLYNLPSYNKNVINKHVCVTYGRDNTGDINNWDNIEYINKLAGQRFFLVTADGGFDEGSDFNHKEQLHYSLILSEIFAAVKSVEKGGHFILKVFDIFTETSIHFLYMLSQCFSSVSVYKPKTSRPTNSEKYIVCKDFRLENDVRDLILDNLYRLQKDMKKSSSKFMSLRIFKDIPQSFVAQIKEMNEALIAKQCDHLKTAIELCHDDSFFSDYEERLDECMEERRAVFSDWEETYNLDAFV